MAAAPVERSQVPAFGNFLRLRLLVKQVKHARTAGKRLLQRGTQVRHGNNRAERRHKRRNCHESLASVNNAAAAQRARQHHHDHVKRQHQAVRGRHGPRRSAFQTPLNARKRRHALVKFRGAFGRAPELQRFAQTAQAVKHEGVHGAQRIAQRAPVAARRFRSSPRSRDAHQRIRDECRQSQLPRHRADERHHNGRHDDRDKRRRKRMCVEHFQQLDIGRDQRHQIALRTPFKLRRGQRTQLAEHMVAHQRQNLERKILALVRDHVFGKLRTLAPAKLEGRSKGDLVSLVTSDVELLEVFYAHTLSPALIAIIVSAIMVAFIGSMAWQLGLAAFVAYALVGIAAPWAASKAAGRDGRALRDALGSMNAFVLDSLRGLRETLQFGRTSERSAELDERMAAFSGVERRLKSRAARAMAATNGLVLALDVVMVMLAGALCGSGVVDAGQAFVAIAALMSSFGPVIAVANLGSTLQQTLASGARVLDLLDEQPQTKEVSEGRDLAAFHGRGCQARRLLVWRGARAQGREPGH